MLQIGLARLSWRTSTSSVLQVLQAEVGWWALSRLGRGRSRSPPGRSRSGGRGGQRRRLGAPAIQVAQEIGQGGARPGRQLVGAHQLPRRHAGRDALAAGQVQQLLDRGVADAAPGGVDDALEGQVVILAIDLGVDRHGYRGSPPARRTSAHRPPCRGSAAGQNCSSRRRASGYEARTSKAMSPVAPALLPALDIVGDEARFGLAVPHPAHLDLRAALRLGPQGLAQPALVGGDEPRGGGQDMLCRSVVALQADHARLGNRARSAGCCPPRRRASRRSTDRRRRRSTGCGFFGPAASATDTGRHWYPGTHPPAGSESARDIRPTPQDSLVKMARVAQQQVAEIARVQDPQPLLMSTIQGRARSAAKCPPSAGGSLSGAQPRFFH